MRGESKKGIVGRFLEKTKPAENGCIVWIAGLSSTGYGQFIAKGKRWNAHQFNYERIHGKTPDGLELDHICQNKACVNPEHLEPVTHRENMLRHHRSKTECRNGHALRPETTRIYKGWRYCKLCQRENCRKRFGYQGNPLSKDKTHCKRGHSFLEFAYHRPDGGRDCKICMRIRSKRAANL